MQTARSCQTMNRRSRLRGRAAGKTYCRTAMTGSPAPARLALARAQGVASLAQNPGVYSWRAGRLCSSARRSIATTAGETSTMDSRLQGSALMWPHCDCQERLASITAWHAICNIMNVASGNLSAPDLHGYAESGLLLLCIGVSFMDACMPAEAMRMSAGQFSYSPPSLCKRRL